jgi:hypothetical protein
MMAVTGMRVGKGGKGGEGGKGIDRAVILVFAKEAGECPGL